MKTKLRKHAETIEDAFRRVVESGDLILGQHVDSFEKSFAHYIGVENCIGVGNGSDAIEIALLSLELPSNASVGLAANAGGYARIALESRGYNPVYADVDEGSHCLSIDSVKYLIEFGVEAIIITHLYGRIAPDIESIASVCQSAGVWLIEDCAQAHGAMRGTRKAGTFGDVATFSFYPTKNLGGVGDAGALVTNSRKLADKIRKLRTYGWTEKYKVEFKSGRNSRMDATHAAVLEALLPFLDSENAERRLIAKTIAMKVKSKHIEILNQGDEGCNFHLLVLVTEYREQLEQHLRRYNIGSAVHYPIPDHKQNGWRSEQFVKLPVTENLSSQVLSIPCFPGMSQIDINRIASVLNEFKPE